MKRTVLIMLLVAGVFIQEAMAQKTPVEKLIERYSEVKGARDFIASGGKMVIARSLIKKTELASIAPDVDVLEVLKMQNASSSDIVRFEKDLKSALAGYEFYGTEESPNGTVDVYIMKGDGGMVDELVIYNPLIHSLNSLKGSFTIQELLDIR
ncbi:MAG: DUF4252 domain-containing protein [Bacteroidales bacterium]|nr:DUF4252 domain-containing protein [Bacteroidales bacterium]